MTEATELSLSDLHSEMSNDVAEQAIKDTLIPTGRYTAHALKLDVYETGAADEFNPNRRMARFFLELIDANGQRAGTTNLKVSWQLRLNANGGLDGPAKKYDQLRKALGLGPKTPVNEVLGAASDGVPFSVKIEEMYKVAQEDLHNLHVEARLGADGNAWVTLAADDHAARSHYIEYGYEPLTVVKSISRAV